MGPIKAAAALACLLGLAACGGGGGGGTGSAGGGNGGPMPMPMPFFLEQDADNVATLNAVIATPTTPRTQGEITRSRLGKPTTYSAAVSGGGPPNIEEVNLSPYGVVGTFEPRRLEGDVWQFTHEYTQDGTDYRALVVMSYDSTLTEDNDRHYWGVWMRQNRDTGAWDDVNPFNNRSLPNDEINFDTSQFSGFEGSYSFTGGANGVYTKDGATAGWFSADTRLTVNYGGTDVPQAERFTMTGTIENFVLSGLEKVDWSVTLAGTPPGSGGSFTDVYFSGTATTGGTQDGSFRAEINYPTRQATGTPLLPPIWVMGVFDAYFDDGVAIGGFNGSR